MLSARTAHWYHSNGLQRSACPCFSSICVAAATSSVGAAAAATSARGSAHFRLAWDVRPTLQHLWAIPHSHSGRHGAPHDSGRGRRGRGGDAAQPARERAPPGR